MKPRRWILALLILPALLVLGIQVAWRLWDLDERLRLEIITMLRESGQEQVELQDVRPAWLGVDLRRLGFSRPGGGLKLRAESVRLRLSPLGWLKSPRQALAAVDWIELRDLKILLDSSLLKDRDPDSTRVPGLNVWLTRLSPALQTLPEIRLRGCRISWQDPGKDERLLVDQLEGLAIRANGRLEILLRSQVLETRHHAFQAELTLDPVMLDGSFQLSLDSLSVALDRMPGLSGLPGLKTARVRTSLALGGRLREARLDSLAGQGRLELLEGLFGASPDPLSGQVLLHLSQNGIQLEQGHLAWSGQELTFGGTVPWLAEGSRIEWEAPNLDLRGLVAGLTRGKVMSKLNAGGTLSLSGVLAWQDGPRSDLGASLEHLKIDGRTLGSLQALASWSPDSLLLKDLSWAPLPGLAGRARGSLLGHGRDLELSLDADVGLDADRLGMSQGLFANSSRLDMAVQVRASRRGKNWRLRHGAMDGVLTRSGDVVLLLKGGALADQPWDGAVPEGGLVASFPGGLPLGSLQLLDGAERHWVFDLDASPQDLASSLGLKSWRVPEDLQAALRLEGRGLQTLATMNMSLRGRRVSVQGALDWSDSTRVLNADLDLEGWRDSRLHGQIQTSLIGRRLEVRRLQLEDLEVSGWVDLAQHRYLLELGADDLVLQPFWDFLMEDPPPFALGSLGVLAAGEGDLDSLGLRGGLEWRQRFAERLVRLRGDLAVNRHSIRVDRGRLSLEGQDWATLDLDWAMEQGARELRLELLDRDLSELLPTVKAGGRSLLQGRISGLVQADLRAKRDLEAWLSVDRPRVGGQVFERLNLRLSRGLTEGTLLLDSLVLHRGGPAPLRLELGGLVPINGQELDLNLLVRGDLLQPLAVAATGKPSRFFRQATGFGELHARLGGSLLDPLIREGRIDLRQGRMDLSSVFRRVRDFELRAEVRGGRLEIDHCEARIERTRLRITNTWDMPDGAGNMEFWLLERPELDLGIIALETLDNKGYPAPLEINIPGLMEPDWNGRIVCYGALPGERLYLSGPADRPVVRGLIRVENTEFTFPFLVGEAPPTPLLSAILAFLNRIDWDLRLLGGRNVNYWRKVQGFDDQRYMERLKGFLDRITVDVYLDPMAQPVLFSGQLEDESFRVIGEIASSRGSVVFLDKDFEVDEAGMSFDASTLDPMVWGRAVHHLQSTEQDPGQLGLIDQDQGQIYLQFSSEDELGNRQVRGRWEDIRVELAGDLAGSQDLIEQAPEELLVEMGLNPYDPGGALESMLPDVVAGFWEIPLRPIESRLRRKLGLDEVRIFLPVLRNTVEELITTQSRQDQISQSYLNYLQGTRVTLGKTLSPRTFASWTGQLVASAPVEGDTRVRVFQRCNLDYIFSRNLSLTGELVFDPLREAGALRGDPRILLRYRQTY